MILKPTRALENKSQLIDMAGLLIDLRKSVADKYTDASPETIQWAVEQAIMRLSLRDGHEFV